MKNRKSHFSTENNPLRPLPRILPSLREKERRNPGSALLLLNSYGEGKDKARSLWAQPGKATLSHRPALVAVPAPTLWSLQEWSQGAGRMPFTEHCPPIKTSEKVG